MFEEAFTFEKLLIAHKKCRRSKQHKRATISFEINLASKLSTISQQILSGKFKLGEYRVFKIYEPKERLIEALPYNDRVVLMAFCTNIIEPKLEKSLIFDNVACRKGKGTLFGIKRLHKFLHDYYHKFGEDGYFLKCDVRKYFQSINHEILLKNLHKTALDAEDLKFVEIILNSKNSESGVGLPIGNQTSQWFGLFYLNKIDRLVKETLGVKYYVRYMDDMILVHHDKEFLKFCKEQIEKCANEQLKLQLNSKTQIGKLSNGIDFLGFRHILSKNGKVLCFLRGHGKRRLTKNMRSLHKLETAGLIDEEYKAVRLNAYQAHLKHSHSKRLYLNLKSKYKL